MNLGIQALLLVRFKEDDGLKMVWAQEFFPYMEYTCCLPLRHHTTSLRSKMIDPEGLPQVMGRQYRWDAERNAWRWLNIFDMWLCGDISGVYIWLGSWRKINLSVNCVTAKLYLTIKVVTFKSRGSADQWVSSNTRLTCIWLSSASVWLSALLIFQLTICSIVATWQIGFGSIYQI